MQVKREIVYELNKIPEINFYPELEDSESYSETVNAVTKKKDSA